MTVYCPTDCRTWRYDFWLFGQRHRGNTQQTTREQAKAFEEQLRVELRQGRADQATGAAPHFTEWAGIYYGFIAPRVERPEAVDMLLRVVLRFWGRKPKDATKVVDGEPYHDLTLADPIRDPNWLLKFEQWMVARRAGPQMRNHFRSIMSRMYRVALYPQYRGVAHVAMNPFAGIPRDDTRAREVTLTPAQIRTWMSYMSYHVRLAVAIAALAPKLRKANVLALRWDTHLDPTLTYITVQHHKTVRKTKRPLVTPISAQLRAILEQARKRHPASPWVVTYHNRPVKNIVHGVKEAAARATIPYGRDSEHGATFHTLRHSANTLLAGEGTVSDALRAAVLGHADLATNAKYTHLDRIMRPQKDALERLSKKLPLAQLVAHPRQRATKTPLTPVGESGGPGSRARPKRAGKPRSRDRARKQAPSRRRARKPGSRKDRA